MLHTTEQLASQKGSMQAFSKPRQMHTGSSMLLDNGRAQPLGVPELM